MNIAYYFARRYLFSKKSVNAINIISGISVIGVLISSASLIVILSFYNGLERLIFSMYSAFTPELRIEPLTGKVFDANGDVFAKIKRDPRIVSFDEVLQERVLLRYDNGQYIATIKGVSVDSALDRQKAVLRQGRFRLEDDGIPYAVMGARIQGMLGISLRDPAAMIEVFSPRKGRINTANPAEEFTMRPIRPMGVLDFQQEYDDLLIVPIDFAREVLDEYDNISAVELDLSANSDIAALQQELSALLGPAYVVKNREQQNPTLYKIVRSEKWAVFFIIAFTGMIAIFNIVGSLTMLVIDKKQDVAVLVGLGADKSLIRRIFFLEGMLISLIGCVTGLFLGLLFCLAQDKWGWIGIGNGENLITDAYPVDVRAMDFLLVFVTVFVVSAVIALIASRLSVRQTVRLS